MDMDINQVKKIIGHHPRFITPFSEPYAYYIFATNDQEYTNINKETITLYWKKLEYAVQNADFLIKQAFHISYYEAVLNLKISVIPKSPDDMCQRLIFDSFVLFPEQKEIGSVLSNVDFMPGHFIDCCWDYNWNFIGSYFC